MKEIKDHNCPYCNQYIETHIRDPKNIVATSGMYVKYSWSGLRLYADDYYKCPYCNKSFYITRRYNGAAYRYRNIPEVGFEFDLKDF